MADSVSWPRRLWRNAYWWRTDLRVRKQYPGLRQIVYFGGHGIGDELLLTGPLHELRQRGGTGLGVMTSQPDFFLHSPDVDAVHPVNHVDVGFLRRVGVTVSQAVYIHDRLPPDIDVPPKRHLLVEMTRQCGVAGPVELRPRLWLSPAETERTAQWHDCIAVQASRSSASLAIGNKEWLPERFQTVVDHLSRHHRVIQLGLPGDPLLHGAEDLRGRMSPRETGVVLAGARAFVGLVGFLMHLARAVECPAVIVYGGRERPDQSGYAANENLYSPVPCAPCWRWNSCDFEHRCMTQIEASHVIAATERLLARPRGPLAVERAVAS